MRAAGRKPQHRIARANRAAVDDRALFHHADGETGKIVLAGRVHAGHFRRLAADQRAAGQLAAARDTLDHIGGGSDIELAAGEVVEEKQRLGTLHQHVVDAHRDQVDSHRIVAVQLKRQFQLGADTVGTRHQNGLAVFFRDFDQRAEAADAGQHLGPHRTHGVGLDRLDQSVTSGDVHAGIAI